jgi:cytochrome P450
VAKLRREILEHVGPTRRPTYEDLKDMRYLQHTMNETLRKYPSVSANLRCALKDTTLPRGGGPDGLQPLGILKGTEVAYSPIFMQRDARLFPPPSAEFPDVLEFAPERWDHWIPKAWHYIPFVSQSPRSSFLRKV